MLENEPVREKTNNLGSDKDQRTQTGLYSHRRWSEAGMFGLCKPLVEELYYPCSENKGADQLRSYWGQLFKIYDNVNDSSNGNATYDIHYFC